MHIDFTRFEKQPFIKASQRFFKDLGLKILNPSIELPSLAHLEFQESLKFKDFLDHLEIFQIVKQHDIECFAVDLKRPFSKILTHSDLFFLSKILMKQSIENHQIYLIKDPQSLHMLSFSATDSSIQIISKITKQHYASWHLFFESLKHKYKKYNQLHIHADLLIDLLKKQVIQWFKSTISLSNPDLHDPLLYLHQTLEIIFLEAFGQNQSLISDFQLQSFLSDQSLGKNALFEKMGIAQQTEISSLFLNLKPTDSLAPLAISELIGILRQYAFFNPLILDCATLIPNFEVEWVCIPPRFLGELYEQIIDLPCFSHEIKKKNGRFFTKFSVAKMMANLAFESIAQSINPPNDWTQFKMIDPCVGGGQILLASLQTYLHYHHDQVQSQTEDMLCLLARIFESNLYMTDIDPLSLKISALSLCFALPLNQAPIFKWQMAQIDGLSANCFEEMAQKFQITQPIFDLLIANPPYGQVQLQAAADDLPIDKKDEYAIFLYRWLSPKSLLKAKGKVLFLTSDTFMSIASHEKLRIHLLQFKINRLIKLNVNAFKATVHTCIIDLSYENCPPTHCLQILDFSQVPTSKFSFFTKQTMKANEKVTSIHHPQFALDQYPQHQIFQHPQHVFFSCSLDAFAYLSTTNLQSTNLQKLKTYAQIKVGLQTGDNQNYLFQTPTKNLIYPMLSSELQAFTLNHQELVQIQSNENLRQKIIYQGFSLDPKSDRYLNGKWIVPYDKGEESDVNALWLPNYHVPTHYWLKWDEKSVQKLHQNQLARSSRERANGKYLNTKKLSYLRNMDFYFKSGISYSSVGTYAPSFRLGSGGIFGHTGPSIFCESIDQMTLLGLLCSKWIKFLLKNLINHTNATEISNLGELPIITKAPEIGELVHTIIQKQQIDQMYPYMQFEQRLIDRLVYQIYQVQDSLINEVECWYQRRYPQLFPHNL